MTSSVKAAFEADSIVLPVKDLLPLKQLPPTIKTGHRYQQIVSSIREIGLIEPPVVARDRERPDVFLLLDGHLRIEALKELGIHEAACLVSTDDESFTYNRRINRIATIQEHKMIRTAIERGVSEEKIAKVLNINVHSVHRKVKLLDGICDEAAELLRDKHCSMQSFGILRKMMPMRQVEAASLMVDMNNYAESYVKALLAATPQDQLANPTKPKRIRGLSAEQISRMEKEMESLQREFKLIEQSYGGDMLNLVVARGYIVKLLSNARVVRYLSQHYREILGEFQNVAELSSIGGKEMEPAPAFAK